MCIHELCINYVHQVIVCHCVYVQCVYVYILSLGLISCARLYDLLTFRPEELLVVDCRKRSDTMVSRVNPKKYPQWLLVPQEVIEKG